MKALKYGMVFTIPLLFFWGAWSGSAATFAPVIFAFVAIPILEFLFAPNPVNIANAEREMMRIDRSYDFMLYLVPVAVYACVVLFLWGLAQWELSLLEKSGLTLSLGVVLGGLGINVAHELGHRHRPVEQFLAKLLLLPCGYMHFFIEHNKGHHKNASTEEDPASARFNESLYHFWARSVYYSYLSAWRIELQRLQRAGRSPWSVHNEMLLYTVLQVLYLSFIFAAFGAEITAWYVAAAVVGFLMLETVNYIEHYGLRRRKVSAHRYERVQPLHSWNSDHVVGRLMLFELSRHSDHHYQPAKKYQLLDHHEDSPQMPTGYPGMMLLAMLPPLWFAVMNPRIEDLQRNSAPTAVQT